MIYIYLHTSTNPKWHIHSCILFSGTQLIVIKQWIWKTTDDDVRTETCELNFQNAVNTTTAPATVQFIKVCDRTQFFLIVIQLWTPEPIVCVCVRFSRQHFLLHILLLFLLLLLLLGQTTVWIRIRNAYRIWAFVAKTMNEVCSE